MKKVLLSAAVIILFTLYSIHQRGEQQEAQQLITLPTIPVPQSLTPPLTPTPTSPQETQPSETSTPPKPTPTTAAKGQYKDGSYTGDSVDVFYGNVQVKAIISGGKITDIQFLDYPNDRQTSRMISNTALPILRSEAIQNQSANVDIVTGATQTSDGFGQSLKSALEQAK